MKHVLIAILIQLCSGISLAQMILPGEYEDLKLAFDGETNKVTGYFESYSGWDEGSSSPRFSCIFYIEGTAAAGRFKIQTYYPSDKMNDLIEGTMEVVSEQHDCKNQAAGRTWRLLECSAFC